MAETKEKPSSTGGFEGEVVEDLHPLLEKITENFRFIAIAAGAIVLAVAISSAVVFYKKNQFVEAQNELGRIVTQTQGESKVQALDDFARSAPEALRKNALLELAKSAALAGDYEKAANAWNDLAKTTHGPENAVALMGKAQALARKGDYATSLDILQNLKTKAPETFRVPIARQIAAIAEVSEEYAVALNAYEELLELGQPGDEQFVQYKVNDLKAKLENG